MNVMMAKGLALEMAMRIVVLIISVLLKKRG